MKVRAPRNRTLTLDGVDRAPLADRLVRLDSAATPSALLGRTICQDLFDAIPHLPSRFVDLMIVDPPYNLDKSFNGNKFRRQSDQGYAEWFDSWLAPLRRVLKPSASIYICSDWRCSSVVQEVGERYFKARNRITWEREKGRGALRNWKSCSEDVWFFTVSDDYVFNVDAVKLLRRLRAPYTDEDGEPKDWTRAGSRGFRLTYPSNLWTDLSVPFWSMPENTDHPTGSGRCRTASAFWSMPENTDHPTQKPEKLMAKLILASSNVGGIVFDPFLGSGTTSVVARKLGRRYLGVELNETYCCLAEMRIRNAGRDDAIQGYRDGVFWERNSMTNRKNTAKRVSSAGQPRRQ